MERNLFVFVRQYFRSSNSKIEGIFLKKQNFCFNLGAVNAQGISSNKIRETIFKVVLWLKRWPWGAVRTSFCLILYATLYAKWNGISIFARHYFWVVYGKIDETMFSRFSQHKCRYKLEFFSIKFTAPVYKVIADTFKDRILFHKNWSKCFHHTIVEMINTRYYDCKFDSKRYSIFSYTFFDFWTCFISLRKIFSRRYFNYTPTFPHSL